MQAVILAAGKGTRMGDLTKDTPKVMLSVAGKSILEWKLAALPKEIDEIVLVVGYHKEKIQNAFGESFQGKRIRYVEQANPVGGTMDALLAARPLLHDTFVVTNGDDLHDKSDIAACIEKSWAFAVERTTNISAASSVITNEAGELVDIIEADVHKGSGELAGVGLYVLDERIFDVEPVRLPRRTEVGLPQTMLAAARKHGLHINVVRVSSRFHFTFPEDISAAEQALFSTAC